MNFNKHLAYNYLKCVHVFFYTLHIHAKTQAYKMRHTMGEPTCAAYAAWRCSECWHRSRKRREPSLHQHHFPLKYECHGEYSSSQFTQKTKCCDTAHKLLCSNQWVKTKAINDLTNPKHASSKSVMMKIGL